MRVEFWVEAKADHWSLRRGRHPLREFEDRDLALAAAQGFARSAADRGETAVVKLHEHGATCEVGAFKPDLF